METQSDQKVRVVALSNLRAMCERISGTCHRYQVTTVSRSRVHVEYSNPDEYGNESPMVAVFPCYPNYAPGNAYDDNPNVVLDALRTINDPMGDGYAVFRLVLDCPTLWRSSVVEHPGVPDRWETHHEINVRLNATPIDRVDSCTVCDLPVAYEAHCNACGWKSRHEVLGKELIEAQVRRHKCLSAYIDTPTGMQVIDRKPDVTVRAITRSEVS